MLGVVLPSFGEVRVDPPLSGAETELLEALRCDVPPARSQLANPVVAPAWPCGWRATDDGRGLRFEGDGVALRVAAEWLEYLIAAFHRSGPDAAARPAGFTFDHVMSGHVDVVDTEGRWIRVMPSDAGVTELVGVVVFPEVRIVPRTSSSAAVGGEVAA